VRNFSYEIDKSVANLASCYRSDKGNDLNNLWSSTQLVGISFIKSTFIRVVKLFGAGA